MDVLQSRSHTSLKSHGLQYLSGKDNLPSESHVGARRAPDKKKCRRSEG